MPEVTTHPIIEAHYSLMEQIDLLSAAITGQPGSASECCRLLAEVRRCVLNHFRIEEEGGYMAAVLQQQPFLQHTADKLLLDHKHLTRELDAIVADMQQRGIDFPAACGRTAAWISRIRDHERQENLLVEYSFGQDLGTKD